jgi:hypothetical protein
VEKISSWFQDLVHIFKNKTNKQDPLLRLLKAIGFRERNFLSLAFDPQFRSVLKKTNYANYIGVLSQSGDKECDGITATLYVKIQQGRDTVNYAVYLIVSSDSNPISIFNQAPQLIIPLEFDEAAVCSIIQSWLESIITLHVTLKLSKRENEKELRVIEKVL